MSHIAGVNLLSAWSLTPAWYHIVFLALLIPATLFGGGLRGKAVLATG